MPKMYTRYAQDMPKMCSRYTQDTLQICPRYVQDMPKICPRYAQDMPEICARYARDMHKISQRNMQKKSWGIMSTIFTQVGAKCPWGILSWGILSFGAKCLGAKCLLAVFQLICISAVFVELSATFWMVILRDLPKEVKCNSKQSQIQ